MLQIVRDASKQVGGVSALARALGISRPPLYDWQRVPAEFVLPIERLTEGRISRHDLRPDLYPPAEAA